MCFKPLDLPLSNDGIIEIAGPCSAESESQIIETAAELADIGIKIFRAGIWKPRTHPGGFEGVGIPALDWMEKAKKNYNLLTATEVASSEHARDALYAGIDILWIGARTTANPFAVQEIAETIAHVNPETPVLVKNPINPDIELWIGALERLSQAGIHRLGAIHRGFSRYGEKYYRNSPIWQIPIELKLRYPALPIIHDPSHTGGRRPLIPTLSREAMQMGFDGLMIETHINPEKALSDSDQQITPAELQEIRIKSKHTEIKTEFNLSQLRSEIDDIDTQLISLLSRRMEVSRMIGKLKRNEGMKLLQPDRFNSMLTQRKELAERLAVDPVFISKIMKAIHEESIRQQLPPRSQ